MSTVREYVEYLTETIGPRPATSDAERHGADWLVDVMVSYGLAPEIQDFETPRSLGWTMAAYHLAAVISAVGFGLVATDSLIRWIAWPVLVAVAVGLTFELNGRFALARIMPKGPSQNVVTRYIPHAKYGEKRRKIVLISHMDTGRGTPLNKETRVKTHRILVKVAYWSIIASVVLLGGLLLKLGFLVAVSKLVWWLCCVLMIVPAVLAIDAVIGELFPSLSPGANDSASGLGVLLGVVDALAEGKGGSLNASNTVNSSTSSHATTSFAPVDTLWTPPQAMNDITQQTTDLPEDFAWADVAAGETSSAGSAGPLSFETIEFGTVSSSSSFSSSTPSASSWAEETFAPEDVLGADIIASEPEGHHFADESKKGWSLPFTEKKPKKKRQAPAPAPVESTDWLGLDETFDARSAGKEIGSWDNFGETPSNDDFGWKGGWAGDDPIDDFEFASNQAARIRRRVTEGINVSLDDKEIWFVATGSRHVNSAGMQAFLAAAGNEMRDAMIINIDSVGAGELCWYSAEGGLRSHKASARITSLAKRVARDNETRIKHSKVTGPLTDASPALAERKKACTITRLSPEGVSVGINSAEDTLGRIHANDIEDVIDFVLAMIDEV